jgi:hypothetical protein
MPADQQSQPPPWSVDTLRVYLESMIRAVDRKHDARTAVDAAHRAELLEALKAADARAAQQVAQVRADAEAALDRLSARISELGDRVTRAEGGIAGGKESKASLYSLIATIGVVITIVVVVASIINGTAT